MEIDLWKPIARDWDLILVSILSILIYSWLTGC